MAAADPDNAHGHNRASSLQVLRRVCLTVSFFAVWVMARRQPDPMQHFGAMLTAASIACALGSRQQNTRYGATIEPLG
jgi:hypothetical protein